MSRPEPGAGQAGGGVRLLGRPHRLSGRRRLDRVLERAAAAEPSLRAFSPAKMPLRAIRRLSPWPSRFSLAPLITFARHLGADTPHLEALRRAGSYGLPIDFPRPLSRNADAVPMALELTRDLWDAARVAELPEDVRDDVLTIREAWAQARRWAPDASEETLIELVSAPSIASSRGLLRELGGLRAELNLPDELLGAGPSEARARALLAHGDGTVRWGWLGLHDLASRSIEHGLLLAVG